EVRSGQSPSHADAEIIRALELFAKGEECAPLTSAAVSLTEVVSDAVDDEFAAMLDAAAAASDVASVDAKVTEASVPVKSKSPATGEITEDEFESLLDQLHGVPEVKPASVAIPVDKKGAKTDASDLITDNEFEQLLDNLQQKRGTAAPTPVVKEDSTIKSESASFAAKKPAEAATPAGEHTTAETTVRVDTKRLDDIMNLVGELVLVRNRLATLRESMSDEVGKTVANLDLVTADLQNAVMKTRMQPIKKVFGRFPRVVRDLARTLNKQVTLELIGEETDLDKNLVEALADPLVHLVRNSVDHGIESPAVRVEAGKTENGTVILSAEQEGDHILLTINDDGAGMDPELLRRKVVEKGLMDEDAASRLDQQSCFNLIFMPGFSTKAEISDISGRGVGMDVVKTRITQLNGTINIDSELGRGTCIKIKVPLTLAIMPTLMVKLGDQVFALPLANVIEIFDSESART
ncbi:MAG: two-component system chemotaxis family sensor kinase CheA, partial [Halothiobacillaceae bacterium]